MFKVTRLLSCSPTAFYGKRPFSSMPLVAANDKMQHVHQLAQIAQQTQDSKKWNHAQTFLLGYVPSALWKQQDESMIAAIVKNSIRAYQETSLLHHKEVRDHLIISFRETYPNSKLLDHTCLEENIQATSAPKAF